MKYEVVSMSDTSKKTEALDYDFAISKVREYVTAHQKEIAGLDRVIAFSKKLEQLQSVETKRLYPFIKELKEGFENLNIYPSSTAEDYLAGTSLVKTQKEAIHGDWLAVGDQLAHSIYQHENG